MDELQRDIGRMEADIETLKETVKSMNEKLDLLTSYMAETKGSWKALLALAGAASAIGSFITWAITTFWKK